MSTFYRSPESLSQSGKRVYDTAQSEFDPSIPPTDLIGELTSLTDEICAELGSDHEDPGERFTVESLNEHNMRVGVLSSSSVSIYFGASTLTKTTHASFKPFFASGEVLLPTYSFTERWSSFPSNWEDEDKFVDRSSFNETGQVTYRWQPGDGAIEMDVRSRDVQGNDGMNSDFIYQPEDVLLIKSMIRATYPPSLYEIGARGMLAARFGISVEDVIN